MSEFFSIFGIEEQQIKKNCVLAPFKSKNLLDHLSIGHLEKGRLYITGSNPAFTLITTGIGSALLGDAVLYLKDTPCENIILLGPCGLLKRTGGMDIGSLVIPSECYAFDSFIQMLSNSGSGRDVFYPDKILFEIFLEKSGAKKVSCATVSSLKLESAYRDVFDNKNIQVLDMESSALFAAAKHTGLKAVSLMYVSDILDEKPFYADRIQKDKDALRAAVKKAASITCKVTKTILIP